jgi:uncharacterized membrane protein YphA (DoxX/SURF4 family)
MLKFPRRLPLRLVTGAFILNSGLSKREAGAERAKQLHSFASGAYPFLEPVPPDTFVQVLSTTEIALGTALLIPVVPTREAAAALLAFSAGLLGLYMRTPSMHEEDSLRPTEAGIGVSKDVWMFGIAAALMVDALLSHDR